MRYLERGSEKSFRNFRDTLYATSQGYLVNAMRESVSHASRQRPCASVDPVPCNTPPESMPISCTEHSGDETKTSSNELATESTQGSRLISLYSYYFLLFRLVNTLLFLDLLFVEDVHLHAEFLTLFCLTYFHIELSRCSA